MAPQPPRKRHDCERGVHVDDRRYDPSVCDVQSFYVVRLAVRVDDRARGVASHPARALHMVAHVKSVQSVFCSGLVQSFPAKRPCCIEPCLVGVRNGFVELFSARLGVSENPPVVSVVNVDENARVVLVIHHDFLLTFAAEWNPVFAARKLCEPKRPLKDGGGLQQKAASLLLAKLREVAGERMHEPVAQLVLEPSKHHCGGVCCEISSNLACALRMPDQFFDPRVEKQKRRVESTR